MNSSTTRRCRTFVIACLASAALAAPVGATHFRYGHITWTHVGVATDRTIAYTVTNAWRQDAVSNGTYRCVNPAAFVNQGTALPTVACTGPLIAGERNPGPTDVFVELVGGTRFDFGDGSPTVGGPGGDPLLYLVTSHDPASNWVFAQALDPTSFVNGTRVTDTTIQHTYATTGAKTARIDDCCRFSPCTAPNAHMNNPDNNYRVQTVVDVGSGNSSPVSALPPIVLCPINALCTFPVPVSDNELDGVTFRMATTAEAQFTSQPGPPQCVNNGLHNASIHPVTGVYSWETTTCRLASSATPQPPAGGCNNGSLNTLYSTQIMIEEPGKGTRTALDFLIQLVPACTLNTAPVFNQLSPLCGSTISAGPGTPVNFAVSASDPNPGNITLNAAGVPAGATFAPLLPASANPVGTTLSWTPNVGQIGQHVITFSAADGCTQTLCAITVDVSQENCTDGVDNDGDGDADCADADCNGTPCDDGNACTQNDVCNGGLGICQGAPAVCNDNNACTTDTCNPGTGCVYANNSNSCDDGLFCNGADTCSGGGCNTHGTDPCAGGGECADLCNEATDSCFDPNTTPCTSDGNVCTDDHCSGSGTCVHTANTAPCPDGLFCNGADVCSGGTCGHSGDPCAAGGECADACNEATDSCSDPNGTPCTDDGNVCTNDACNGAGVCVHPFNSGPCNDGLFCNGPDTCSSGTCSVHGGNPCSAGGECADACNEAADNCFDANGAPCTGDGNVCTGDQCNGSGACVHPNLPNGTPCVDGNACTVNTTCQGGNCNNGSPLDCDDSNPCTDDACNPTSVGGGFAGCVYTNNDDPCDDGLFCTMGDACSGGSCSGPPANCDDSNPCTADSCNETTEACDHNPGPLDGQPCDDGNACTQGEICEGGMCIDETSSPLDCVDHYKCYRTMRTPFEQRTVSLVDQFGGTETSVIRPARFCNPVDKNGEGILDPSEHLMCYTIRESIFARRDVRVTNQFGQQTLTVVKPLDLCLPAEKNGVPANFNINHFKCYRVRGRGFTQRTVGLADQFENKTTQVLKPHLLCNPADKNGEGVPNPEGHLTCYKIKDAPGQPKFTPEDVTVRDQFAQQDFKTLRGDCRKISYLCVPSLKEELP